MPRREIRIHIGNPGMYPGCSLKTSGITDLTQVTHDQPWGHTRLIFPSARVPSENYCAAVGPQKG